MDFINSWVQSIIVAVIIATIIEMILPNGNSNKYIKVVIGVYIVFNIISPIITKFTGKELTFSSIIDINKYDEQVSTYEINTKDLESNNNSNIKEVYILNLKKDMKSKIEEKGYTVNTIQIELEDNEEYTVKSVNLNMSKNEKSKRNEEKQSNRVNKIENINIEVEINNNSVETLNSTSTLTSKEIDEIKEYINSIYEIAENKIVINK